jgi:hypothetical protein
MQTITRSRLIRAEVAAVQMLAITIAVMLIAIGVTLLSSPLAVPLTVALWLGAACVAFVGLFVIPPGRL